MPLKPEQEKFIAEAMETGGYDDAAEVIDRAFEQFEQGDFLTAEESRADMAHRKAEWLASSKP